MKESLHLCTQPDTATTKMSAPGENVNMANICSKLYGHCWADQLTVTYINPGRVLHSGPK